jgi:hypothetical protein
MEIPNATLYPWAPSERLLSLQPHKLITSTSKSTTPINTYTSTGFSYLQHELNFNKSPSQISETAKSLLSNLLDEHNIELSQEHSDAALQQHAPPAKKQKMLVTVSEDMSDDTVLQMAAAGELSFFGSLLATIEHGGDAHGPDAVAVAVAVAVASDSGKTTSTSTRTLIKTCSLAVPPASAPATMDCKEMVMAALHFLSSVPTADVDADAGMDTQTDVLGSANATHNLLRLLPLIRPQQMTPDLEKRSYQKVGDWKLTGDAESEFQSQVAALEQVFLYGSNSKDYVWLNRERFCPRLATGEDLLLLKGNPPVHATGKPKKATPVQRRKKAPTATTPSATTPGESVLEAVKMGMNEDVDVDDEAEVEAEIEVEAETAEGTNLTEAMEMASDGDGDGDGNASPLGPTF